MRQPKFRGFSLETKQWHNGHGWFEIDYTDEYLREKGIEPQAMLYTENGPIECELKSMGEFTGLKDRNGKEICKGDIVKTATQNNVIEYQHGSFMVLGLHEDKYERTFSTLYHFLIDATIPNVDGSRFDGVTTNLEVIGNIYEHPYLLEGAAG